MPENEKIDFGFQTINKEEKAQKVHKVFESVASQYDVMNDVMSGGLHRVWKNYFVNMMQISQNSKLLDLAGGTGDISFRYLQRAKKLGVEAHATITDINEHMLGEGQNRAVDKNIDASQLDWNIVNAEQIPYQDNSFDFVTIAFGIRNVTDREKALREIYRVLKVGGRFLCLEFSHVDNPFLGAVYDKFSMNIIPKMGQLIANDADSYQYLVESVRKFPNRTKFSNMIENAGFSRVTNEILTHGVVAIHSGWKI